MNFNATNYISEIKHSDHAIFLLMQQKKLKFQDGNYNETTNVH